MPEIKEKPKAGKPKGRRKSAGPPRQAGRLMKEKLAALGKAGMMVSPPFGPGFFGMGMENLPQIMELAGADRIGVSFTGNYMLPLKSCAGFFFTSKTPLNLPAKDCASCTGSRLSCSYCRNYS